MRRSIITKEVDIEFDLGDLSTKELFEIIIERDDSFSEAVARLRRGETFEAILHLERAIPALAGLETAVRTLAKDPS